MAIDGQAVGTASKAIISYLPDRMYFADWMRASDLIDLFADFYKDFDRAKCLAMCASLGVTPSDRLKTMSKGTQGEDAAGAGHGPEGTALPAG